MAKLNEGHGQIEGRGRASRRRDANRRRADNGRPTRPRDKNALPLRSWWRLRPVDRRHLGRADPRHAQHDQDHRRQCDDERSSPALDHGRRSLRPAISRSRRIPSVERAVSLEKDRLRLSPSRSVSSTGTLPG